MTLNPQVVRLRRGAGQDQEGAANYLVFKEGRAFIHAITLDKVVKIVALPKDESRHFKPLEFKGHPYPIHRACRLFLRAGKSLGITAKAKTVLKAMKEAS
jgi:hypothetical protein